MLAGPTYVRSLRAFRECLYYKIFYQVFFLLVRSRPISFSSSFRYRGRKCSRYYSTCSGWMLESSGIPEFLSPRVTGTLWRRHGMCWERERESTSLFASSFISHLFRYVVSTLGILDRTVGPVQICYLPLIQCRNRLANPFALHSESKKPFNILAIMILRLWLLH